jgi:enoyl-CoA hydratase/carnithine racemase
MKSEKYTDVLLSYEDKVARIVINRPEKLNAIRIQTYMELISALKEADEAPQCHVIVLEGAGDHFTAGNDLADLVGDDLKLVMDSVQGIFETAGNLKKVLIAAVEGAAVGIGTTLLLHCDIVIASKKAKFRVPFANLGVCPEGGSSVLLPQAIGQKMARDVLLTGRFFSADEALKWGLITAIAEPGQASQALESQIEALLKQPLPSLIATKKLMRASMPDIGTLIGTELAVFQELLKTQETRSRIAHLLKK